MFVSFENLQEVMYEIWAGAVFSKYLEMVFLNQYLQKKGGEKKNLSFLFSPFFLKTKKKLVLPIFVTK